MKLQKLKSLIKAFDFFSQPTTLRYCQQSSYSSLTGGFCSITLIIIFIAIFANTLTNTLNKIYITSTVTKFQQVDPSYYTVGTDSFIFAVGLSNINLNQGNRWFDIYMEYRSYDIINKNKTVIPLQKCQRYQWEKINKTLVQFYDRLKLQQWLCPKDNLSFQLQGKFTSEMFKFYKIGVKACNNALDPARPCVNSSQIDSYIATNQAFNFNFYFVNTILNPGDKQYISHYFDDFNYFPFSKTTGTNANLFISSYTITTDQSIYPFQQNQQKKGGIVLSSAQVMNYQIKKTQYLKFNIRKSSLSLKVQRSYRKIDDTLSYIGGLFSAIISVCLLMTMYNQFSYQLQIAQSLYKYNKQQKLDSSKFNFFTYLGYVLYSSLDGIGIILPWAKMKMYKRSLDQVRQQMDIRLVFRKLFMAEKVANTVLEPHQIKALHFQEIFTLEEVQFMRQDYQFYSKLEKYYFMFDKSINSAKVDHQNYNHKSKSNSNSNSNSNNKSKNKESTEHNIEKTQQNINKQQNNRNNKGGVQQSVQHFNNRSSSLATPDHSFNQSFFNMEFTHKNKNNKIFNKEQMDKINQKTNEQNIRRQNKQQNKSQSQKILNGQLSKQYQQQIKMKKIIKQLKQYINMLQKQSESGQKISKKIISKLDKRLTQKVMETQTDEKQKQSKQKQKDQQMQDNYKSSIIDHQILPHQNKLDTEMSIAANHIFKDEQIPKIMITSQNKSIKQRKLNENTNTTKNKKSNNNGLNKTMGSLGYNKNIRNQVRKGQIQQKQIKQFPKSIEDLDCQDNYDI